MGKISIVNLFPEKPTIDFKPEVSVCCNSALQIQKTHSKTAKTLDIGEFTARETILECKVCNKVYTSCKLKKLIPPSSNFGYDVLVYVGKSIYLHCRSNKEIIRKLKSKNITISNSGIEYLAKKFVVYLSIIHSENHLHIKKYMSELGGYILHLDATCEDDSPHLMTGLDEISKIVLQNVKLPSESAEKIIPFLEKIKKNFGNPIAVVHDMAKGIINAVKKVFPNILDFICHFHFLRDTGKDLFGKENDVIRKSLKNYGIKYLLRNESQKLKKIIDQNPGLDECITTDLKKETAIEKWVPKKIATVTVYILIQQGLSLQF